MVTPKDSTPTSLYRYYDQAGLLLYVGITSTGIARNRQHNSDKEWWQWVCSQRVDHFPTREAAQAKEVRLIHAHRPPFNRQHNHGHEEIAAAYRAARATGRFTNIIKTAKSESTDSFGAVVTGGNWKRGEVNLEAVTYLAKKTRYCDDKRPIFGGGTTIGCVWAVEHGEGSAITLKLRVKPGWRFTAAEVKIRPNGEIKSVVAISAVKAEKAA
jgi:hypothetical protein